MPNDHIPYDYSEFDFSDAHFFHSTAQDAPRYAYPNFHQSTGPFQLCSSRASYTNGEWFAPYDASLDITSSSFLPQQLPAKPNLNAERILNLDRLMATSQDVGICEPNSSSIRVGTSWLSVQQETELGCMSGERQHVRTDSESPQSSPGAATTAQNGHIRHTQPNTTDQISPSPDTHSAESGNHSTGSFDSGTDVLDSVDAFSDDSDFNCASDISAEKERILDRLMVCVYDMFAMIGSTTHTSRGAHESHQSNNQTVDTFAKSPELTSKKRKERCDRDNNPNEEENDGSRKRLKGREDINAPGQKNERMLACPYFKCNPRKSYPSKKCYGPGWDSVHRIKYVTVNDQSKPLKLISVREHLYRVHSMPLHCRRCYVTFDNEDQLNDHSRLPVSCTIRKAVPMEGFNKDQEKSLKGRRTMFRAGSEEEKWKIVYLILFPNTAPGRLPSPCKLLITSAGLMS
jgi:hypothetical protein